MGGPYPNDIPPIKIVDETIIDRRTIIGRMIVITRGIIAVMLLLITVVLLIIIETITTDTVVVIDHRIIIITNAIDSGMIDADRTNDVMSMIMYDLRRGSMANGTCTIRPVGEEAVELILSGVRIEMSVKIMSGILIVAGVSMNRGE